MKAVITVKDREWYRNSIVNEGKSVKQLAEELRITPAEVRKQIRSLYTRKVWADKLLGIAKSNESRQNVSKKKDKASKQPKEEKTVGKTYYWEHEFARACEEGVAIVDTSFALDNFSKCKSIGRIIIPRFCLNEMRKIAQFQIGEEKQETEDKIRYLEDNAVVLFVEKIPFLDVRYADYEFKPRNVTFARYVKSVWHEKKKRIPCLTRSFEANKLIKEYINL